MATVFNLSEGVESARELSDVIAERKAQSFNRLAQMTREEQRVADLSPTALHEDNMRKQEAALEAKQELERTQRVIQNKSADEIFSRQIADQIAARVDPSTMIKAAVPGNAQWQTDEKYNFAMKLKDGVTFTGKDLVKSVYATKQVVTDMLGEGHAAVFDRAFVAPLDPNYRLHQSAKDAVNPFIGEMQKNGTFSKDYTEESIGVIAGGVDMGIVEKALRGSLEQLQGGANPSDTAIAAMSMVSDSKGFSDYPDAAKKYVLETVAEKIDLLSNNLTAKVGADVSALFNSIDDDTNKAIAGMGVDFDPQELMPVSSQERAGLVREITATRDAVHTNQTFLMANEGVLSIPWADRKVKERYQTASADNDKMKQKLAELYKKATRDVPEEKADPVGSALFGIGASAVEWGTDPEKVEKELGALSQNFAAMNSSDQRKFLAERLVNNWYAANAKDPTKAPINAAIRTKMLETIKSGQKLAPEIEDSLNTVMQNFRTVQAQQSSVELVKARTEKYDKFRSKFQSDFYKKMVEGDDPQALLNENRAFLDPKDFNDYEAFIKAPPATVDSVLSNPKSSRSLKKAALGELEKESATVAATVAESLKFARWDGRTSKEGLLKTADEAITSVVKSGLKNEHKAALIGLITRNSEISGVARGDFVDGYGFDRLYEMHTAATKATGVYGGWSEFMDMYAALDRKLGGVAKDVTNTQKKEIVNSFIKEATDPLMNRMRAAAVSNLANGR